jgi:dTDP-4-dehydrorhamnose 3,5-epimerase
MAPVRMIAPRRFEDSRGWFSETWNARAFAAQGISAEWCQDNHSLSRANGTIRGIHFQHPPHAQAKLVRCLKGRIFDVAVDLRSGSPTFGRWLGFELSAAAGNQLYVPPGFGHGFLTLEPDCEVAYKVDAYYAPQAEGGVAWDDPDLAITWPLDGQRPLLSDKDAALPRLGEVALAFTYDGRPLEPLDA